MPSRPLRQDQNKHNDYGENHARRQRTTEIEAAMIRRLVQKISDGRAKRSRQDEGRPEQEHAGNRRPVIQGCQEDESCTEHERAAVIS